MNKFFSIGFDIIKGTFLLITVPLVLLRLKETVVDLLNSNFDSLTMSLVIWFDIIALVFIFIDYLIIKQFIKKIKRNSKTTSREILNQEQPPTTIKQAITTSVVGVVSVGVSYLLTKVWVPNWHSFEGLAFSFILFALYLVIPLLTFYLSSKLSLTLRKQEETKFIGTIILSTNILLIISWVFLMTIKL